MIQSYVGGPTTDAYGMHCRAGEGHELKYTSSGLHSAPCHGASSAQQQRQQQPNNPGELPCENSRYSRSSSNYV